MIRSHSLEVHGTLNPRERRFESDSDHSALVAQRLVHLFSNQVIGVRFLVGAPQ